MKKIKNFKEFTPIYEESIFSMGKRILKKAGSWLMNLIKAQKNNEIPVRNKKYNPDTGNYENTEIIDGQIQQIEAQPFVKIHLPQGTESRYKFVNPFEDKISEGEEPRWKRAQKTQDTQIIDVSGPELSNELEYHFENPESGRPMLIWGAPGIGKTSVVKSFGLNKMGVPVIEVILSLMEPTDVAGLPGTRPDIKHQDVQRSVNFLPMIWPLDNGDNGKGGIIFLDEINRAHPSVQAAMLKVVLDREIAGANYKIPDKWLILAAANRPEDEPGGMIRPMSFALANRFAQVNFVTDPVTWSAWAKGSGKGMSEDVIAFVELMQDYFYMLPSDLVSSVNAETTMGVTPRAWEYAAREYQERRSRAQAKGSDISQEETSLIFNKHVGKTVSNVITDFLETTKFWPISRISKIFTDPLDPGLEIPRKSGGKPDLQKGYAIMYMASKYKKGSTLTKDEFTNLLTYLTNLDSGELALSAINMTKATHPEIKNYLGDPSLEKYVTPFTTKYKSYMREV